MVPLADLLTDPSRARELPQEALPGLLAQCAALQAVLAARLVVDQAKDAGTPVGGITRDEDRWLTPEEAHHLSKLGTRWLYRHWETVPGAKKFSPKRLRFQERPFRRWLEKRT